MIYTRDDTSYFDPVELDEEITTDAIEDALSQGLFLKAWLMACRLNEAPILSRVYDALPNSMIAPIAQAMPEVFLDRLFHFLTTQIENSRHIERHMQWIYHLFQSRGTTLSQSTLGRLRNLHKAMTVHYEDLTALCDRNSSTIDWILCKPQ